MTAETTTTPEETPDPTESETGNQSRHMQVIIAWDGASPEVQIEATPYPDCPVDDVFPGDWIAAYARAPGALRVGRLLIYSKPLRAGLAWLAGDENAAAAAAHGISVQPPPTVRVRSYTMKEQPVVVLTHQDRYVALRSALLPSGEDGPEDMLERGLVGTWAEPQPGLWLDADERRLSAQVGVMAGEDNRVVMFIPGAGALSMDASAAARLSTGLQRSSVLADTATSCRVELLGIKEITGTGSPRVVAAGLETDVAVLRATGARPELLVHEPDLVPTPATDEVAELQALKMESRQLRSRADQIETAVATETGVFRAKIEIYRNLLNDVLATKRSRPLAESLVLRIQNTLRGDA